MADGRSAEQIGHDTGERFKISVIDSLERIASKLGVKTASLGDGGTSEYSSGPASRFSGNTGKRGVGQRGAKRTGGETYHAKPESVYRGEPVLDEGVAADNTDAAKALREGFKQAQDTEAHIKHGAGTEAAALPDAARDPNAARAAAVQAAQDAGESFSGAASTYNPFKPGWKSGGPETASGERYSETAYTAAIQQQLAHQFWPEGKMGYGKGYQPRYFEAEDPKTGKKVIFKANDIMPFKGRAFDLNEATMRYLDPSMKKGVLSGLKFRPLPPGKEYQAGPVDEGRPAAQQSLAGQARQGEGFNTTFPQNKFTTTANMNPELLARLQAMYDAAPDSAKSQIQSSESGKTFLESGYRPDTRKEAEELGMDPRTSQESVWDRRHGREPGSPGFGTTGPGAMPRSYGGRGSNHAPGNAADIIDPSGWFHQHAREYGLHFPYANDPPHAQMDPRYRGENFYNPNKDQGQQPQAALGPNGEMLVFGGLGGQLDRESAARIAAAKGLTPRYFDYRDTEAALRHAKGLDRPYETMGFSAGVNSQDRFAAEARKRGIQMPSSATAVGQYAPEGGKTKLPTNSGVRTENFLDPSGKGLRDRVPEGHYLEGHHMPTETDRGTMARAADAIEARIAKEKASAAEKEIPEAARNPAAAKAAEPKKEASTKDSEK